MPTANKKVLAVVDDLFFVVKINDMAKRNGFQIEFLKSEKDVLEKALENPALIIFDLNSTSVKPVPLISKLKSDPATKGISIISFVSHVQGELKQQAQDAGCNMVLARSAFSTNLAQIFKRHSSSL
ncbi:MAG: response regulator [Bryobacterales bacterium]|nr:response regulator [Bryobacterales bacterium]